MNWLLADSLGLMPPQASTFGPTVDFWWDFVLWVSMFFFVLIIGIMILFMARYYRRPGVRAVVTPTHSTALELSWTIIPTILVVFMFWGGFKSYMDMRVMPSNSFDVTVNARQWSWEFVYPNGIRHPELHVYKGSPVVLTMFSDDVIHSFFVPAFRAKMDVLPRRYTKLWFEPTRAGRYRVYCTEYCGTSHSDMNAWCIVHENRAEFLEWLRKADPLGAQMTPELYAQYTDNPGKFIAEHPEIQGLAPPVEMGRKLWTQKGCNQCHSADGRAGTGPSWKGIWKQTHEFVDTPARTVDEQYIRDSILVPTKDVVKGYTRGAMPSYQGKISDKEIGVLIEYIRSLSGAAAAPEQ